MLTFVSASGLALHHILSWSPVPHRGIAAFYSLPELYTRNCESRKDSTLEQGLGK